MTTEEVKMLEEKHAAPWGNDYMSKEGRWNGPDCSANWRQFHEQQEAARRATPPPAPSPLDGLSWNPAELRLQLLAARERIAELEKQVADQQCLAPAPHLRNIEKRKVT